jgi:uncharacterized protein involved in exopolysaccharide biosynthesis
VKEILTTLFRRKRAFLAFFACMAAFPLALTYLQSAKYESKAIIMLTASRFKKPFLPDERDSHSGFMQLTPEDVGSEVEIMMSYPVLAKVADTCGLGRIDPPPPKRFFAWSAYQASRGLHSILTGIGLVPEVPPREAAIGGLRRSVHVDFIRRTNVIVVKWRGSSPERARDVVNALVDAYLTHHILVHGNAYMLDALRQQLTASQEQLRLAEDSLSSYTSRNRISDVEKQRRDLLESLGQAEARILVLQSISKRNLSSETLGAITEDPAVAELSRRLTDAEMRRIELSTRYGGDDRKMLAIQQEIEKLKSLTNTRLARSLATWKSLAVGYRAELVTLDAHKVDIDRLHQEIEELQRMVELNREKTDEVVISKAMDKAALAGARVVEAAVADPIPASPKRIPILVISVFFGVVFGIAFVVLLDAGSIRVLSLDDVEKQAKAPVLASVPRFKDGQAPGLGLPSFACAQALLPVSAGLVRDGAEAPLMHSILLVSPSEGAGTTTLCNHLGSMLATQGSTGIVSFDPQSADPASEVTGLERRRENALVRDDRYGIYRFTLPSGSESLVAGAFSAPKVIESIRSAGIRHLLIDGGVPRADARYLQFVHLVDHVIIVASYNLTSKPALSRLADIIRRQGGRLAGCLFNMRDDAIPESIYRRFF